MDELREISHRLSGISKDKPFNVPEHYFEDFPERMLDRIRENRKIPVRHRNLLVLKPYLAAAMIIVVAVISGILIFRNPDGKGSLPDLQTEISQVVEWELYSISEETILEVMQDDSYLDETIDQDPSDEIIDYLLNEDIPVDALLDAL